jgi:peptidoglycan-N-acetylglucosamine deacetylase
MIFVIAISLITAAYVILGRLGMSRIARERPASPPSKKRPMVSIIIPAYKSQATIEKTLMSVRDLDYPRKEVIVVNDSRDNTPEIARRYKARVIQNRKRLGKAMALNRAQKAARGELIFVLDSDTTVSSDCLKRLVPWFSLKNVAAVMPRYLLANDGPVSRLADLENTFTFALLRVHAFFGSLAGFRGCSIMLRKDVLLENPWPDTLLEDNHLAATLVQKGYRIIWEPLAITYTSEPETLGEVKKQKKRWGEGAYLAFRSHRRFYMRSKQFMIFFYPYFALNIATGLLVLSLALSPLLFPGMAVPIVLDLAGIFMAMYVHTLIFLYLGSGKALPGRTIMFMTRYFPVMIYSYSRGVLSGMRRKRNGDREMNFRYW